MSTEPTPAEAFLDEWLTAHSSVFGPIDPQAEAQFRALLLPRLEALALRCAQAATEQVVSGLSLDPELAHLLEDSEARPGRKLEVTPRQEGAPLAVDLEDDGQGGLRISRASV